jgi:hypothetical protein
LLDPFALLVQATHFAWIVLGDGLGLLVGYPRVELGQRLLEGRLVAEVLRLDLT